MRLSIYSLKQILFKGDARSVNCRTQSGEITILDHHRPLISMLVKGAVKIVDAEKKEHYLETRSGFLEVSAQNRVRLLIDE